MLALIVYDTVLEAYPEGTSIEVAASTEIINVFVFENHREGEQALEYWREYHDGLCKLVNVDGFDWSGDYDADATRAIPG